MLESVATLDLGSTWIKSAVFTSDGRRRSLARRPANGLDGQAGRFDAEGYLAVALEVLREAVGVAEASGFRPDKVVCASQRATAVVVDGQGAAMTPAVSWMAPMVDGAAVFRELEVGAFTALTGLPGWPLFPVFRLAAGEEPLRGAVDRGGTLLSLGDFVLGRLGAPPVSEASLAAATGLLDGRRKSWDPGLLRIAGLGGMPPLVKPGTPVGVLAGAPAAATGLLSGIPLVAGGSDQACALWGSGVAGPGEALLSLGTAAAVLAPVRGWPREHRSPIVLPHVVDDQWVAEGFVGAFGAALDRIAPALGLGTASGLVGAAATRPPVERSPLFLLDRWLATPTVPGLALAREPGDPEPDPAGLAALVVESLGFELVLALELVESVVRVDRLRVAGGGTRSRPLVQGLVDVLERPVIDPGEPEAALWGAARLAFGDGGTSGDVGTSGDHVRIEPRPAPGRNTRLRRYRAWKEMKG